MASTVEPVGTAPASIRHDLSARLWVLIVAGIPTGVVVAGVGSRLAMLVLRSTSPEEVIGVTSDDGFEIGRFTLSGTYNLLMLGAVSAVIGVIGGACMKISMPTTSILMRRPQLILRVPRCRHGRLVRHRHLPLRTCREYRWWCGRRWRKIRRAPARDRGSRARLRLVRFRCAGVRASSELGGVVTGVGFVGHTFDVIIVRGSAAKGHLGAALRFSTSSRV